MPVERRALFRPDVLAPRAQALDFDPAPAREVLARWARLLDAPGADRHKETELLPDFLTQVFYDVLGYAGPSSPGDRHTLSRERRVEVDGEFADAVLGDLGGRDERIDAVVEGKGPRDPLDRPFGGRRLSAVEQAFRYAINLPCDWILVTNLREIRLYHKGHDTRTFERFAIADLAADETELRRFVFLLAAERVVPPGRPGHLDDLLRLSQRTEVEVTDSFYDEYDRMRRDLLARLHAANPHLIPEQALFYAQKLLDRVLFVAFAEDRGLLPPETLGKAFAHSDPYVPRTKWETFKGLFRAIDEGRPDLGIPRYNGGLFAADPGLDRLEVPDELFVHFKRLGEYGYRAPADLGAAAPRERQVDVEILGHIFEQSITDLEELERELAAGEFELTHVSRRRRQGAFYTPRVITRFIVGRALQPVLAERFERLRRRHQAAEKGKGTAVRVLDDPAVYDLDALNRPQRDALAYFWKSWLDELQTVRVLDLACGSGAFLIEAFDQLHAVYQEASARVTELFAEGAAATIFEPDRTILDKNLYGVDLNGEAIQICRLSIWIKTAQRGKPLAALDHNIRTGNSLVDDPERDPDALDWRAAFPEVFAAGGFDVVIGNPPYVRQELLGGLKPYLEARFRSYHGMADLYVYFFERGLDLLRPGGRLSYVVTNKWLKAGYAEPLRRHLAASAWVEAVVDLGHAKTVFPDADVFPSIVVLAKPREESPPPVPRVSVISRDEVRLDDLGRQVDEEGFDLDPGRLGATPWTLEPPEVEHLMEKLRRRGVPLAQYARVKPYRGILTGLNEAFLIDTATKERLVAEDARSGELMRPFLRGQDVQRWRAEWAGLWMILLKSSDDHEWPWSSQAEVEAEASFAMHFPSVHRHFSSLRERLVRRQDQGRFWWELRRCVYYSAFDEKKIVWQEIQFLPAFAIDSRAAFANNKVFLLPSSDLFLLAALNSPLLWWHNWRYLVHLKDEALNPAGYKMEELPIARPDDRSREAVEQRVRETLALVDRRNEARAVLLDWLAVEHGIDKPSRSLAELFDLTSDQLVAEVRRARGKKRPISAAELRALREEHELSLAPMAAERRRLEALEDELSDLVNGAYGLTPEEVDVLWRTAPPRMPARPPHRRP